MGQTEQCGRVEESCAVPVVLQKISVPTSSEGCSPPPTHTHSQAHRISLLFTLDLTRPSCNPYNCQMFLCLQWFGRFSPYPLTLSLNMWSFTVVHLVTSHHNINLQEKNRIGKNRIESEYSARKALSTHFEYILGICVICYYWITNSHFSSWLFRFDIDIEPIFATMALYDLKEKKKVRKLCYIRM